MLRVLASNAERNAYRFSFVKVTPGQQVASNQGIAEIKVLDQYKIHTSLSEYYIDRITTGLPATINYQGRKYPLRITKVVPEVKDRTFDVDLVFTGEMPDNVRVGKSFRVQIELGQPEQAIVIPRGNFYQSTGGQWIYKLNASKTKAIRVPLSIIVIFIFGNLQLSFALDTHFKFFLV